MAKARVRSRTRLSSFLGLVLGIWLNQVLALVLVLCLGQGLVLVVEIELVLHLWLGL
jgi:hypothetical protein